MSHDSRGAAPSSPCLTLAALALCACAVAAGAAQAPAATWKPTKPVELIAINAPGGGSDRILRLMINVMQAQKQVPVAVNVVNKPGGGGAVAYNYLNTHPGDAHYLVASGKSFLTNNIIGNGQSYTDYTLVVMLFNEYISVTVKPDSTLRTGKDLIDRAKKDPGALTFAIATALGSPNHQGAAVALKEGGVDVRKMRTVIFPSGGAATTAVMGGHVDVAPVTAAFAASLLRNGQVRILAVASPTRLSGVLSGVPTWREQGFDAVVTNWRGFIGPRGMTPAQIAYWEDIFHRMAESPEWKKELEDNHWASNYLRGAELRSVTDRDYAQQRSLMIDLGLAK